MAVKKIGLTGWIIGGTYEVDGWPRWVVGWDIRQIIKPKNVVGGTYSIDDAEPTSVFDHWCSFECSNRGSEDGRIPWRRWMWLISWVCVERVRLLDCWASLWQMVGWGGKVDEMVTWVRWVGRKMWKMTRQFGR